MEKKKIIIVEDENLLAIDIKDYLEHINYDIIDLVPGAAELFNSLNKKKPDLVLMDIKLEGELDGIEATKILKEKYNLPVIYLTAHADDLIIERAKETNPLGFINKPFSEKDLQVALEMGFYRIEAEKKLKENEEEILKLSQAVKQSPALIVITNTEGNIEYVNPKFTQVTGYSFDEIKGKNSSILKSGHTQNEDYKKLWEAIKSGNEWKGEFYNRKKNGEFYWESASISPIINEDGKIIRFLSVKEDITERKLFEGKLIEEKEKAEKADRLKTEFLAQVSHEIRTPLNNILANTSLLKEEFENKLPEGLETVFEIIDTSARRLVRTIDLILNLSKIQTGNFETKFESFDLEAELLEDILLEFHSRAKKKNIRLLFENKVPGAKIFADKYSLGQIIYNLIDNAAKYTNEGDVSISVYKGEDSTLLLDIKDTGIGISEEYVTKIFNPFVREESSDKRSFEGIGLGLTLVKKYAEINNIDISVKSKKGEGTVFTLAFKNNY